MYMALQPYVHGRTNYKLYMGSLTSGPKHTWALKSFVVKPYMGLKVLSTTTTTTTTTIIYNLVVDTHIYRQFVGSKNHRTQRRSLLPPPIQ